LHRSFNPSGAAEELAAEVYRLATGHRASAWLLASFREKLDAAGIVIVRQDDIPAKGEG
jgi:hypothetical protein